MSFKLLGWYISGILAIILFYLHGCEPVEETTTTKTVQTTEKKYDDQPKKFETKKSILPVFSEPITSKRWRNARLIDYSYQTYVIDTEAVVKACQSRYYFSDNYTDTNISIDIKDTIGCGIIYSRDVTYTWKKPVSIVINTTTTTETKYGPRKRLFFGTETNTKQLPYLSLKLTYVSDRVLLTGGYIPANQSFQIGAAVPITR